LSHLKKLLAAGLFALSMSSFAASVLLETYDVFPKKIEFQSADKLFGLNRVLTNSLSNEICTVHSEISLAQVTMPYWNETFQNDHIGFYRVKVYASVDHPSCLELGGMLTKQFNERSDLAVFKR
jgi:hypothetical protein